MSASATGQCSGNIDPSMSLLGYDRQNDGAITVQDIRNACVSQKTQQQYRSNLRCIVKWLRMVKGEEYHNYVDGDGNINLNEFTPSDFEDFLLAKRNTVKVITLSSYRSALKDLYRRRGLPLPVAYESDLSVLFSGLKRLAATDLQSGNAKESGKIPLSYSSYSQLCSSSLIHSDKGFAHLYLITQWNLMCRSESVQTIHLDHISSIDDSIGCVLLKTKTNQDASGPKDYRHIYANSLNPSTCWFTALAIYLVCRPQQKMGPLFPGSDAKARFGSIFRQMTENHFHHRQYGTHSVRKGVATFACSASTNGPSITSVCIRAGWTIGGVQDRYIRYADAGDQYLGRVVAGLPIHSSSFAQLPPHFKDNSDVTIIQWIEKLFPNLYTTSSLTNILMLCLASIVYHSEFLMKTLPSTHPLLAYLLFTNPIQLLELKSKLYSGGASWMKPSGIPPHINLYEQISCVKDAIECLKPTLLDGMAELIESKGVTAGNITKELLEMTIARLLRRDESKHGECSSEVGVATEYNLHCYNGHLHLLPQSFQFPKVDARGVWFLYWLGDKSKDVPPLRLVTPKDLPCTTMRKTYSDWKCLVQLICEAASISFSQLGEMAYDEANKIFATGMNNIQLAPSTRKRRVADLSYATTLRLAREFKRQKN